MCEDADASAFAVRLGIYPNSLTAASIFSLNLSETCSGVRNALDTVIVPTPASCATSAIVTLPVLRRFRVIAIQNPAQRLHMEIFYYLSSTASCTASSRVYLLISAISLDLISEIYFDSAITNSNNTS